MANLVAKPANATYVSKLNMNGTLYTIQDEWAQAEIEEIEKVIEGGVHFRGISTTAIADGDNLKDLTVNGETYPASKQEDGDLFIYNNGTKNLEFIVSGGKYSELGSTGVLKALAFADTASGTYTQVTGGTVNNFTPTLANTLSVTTTAANLNFSPTTSTVSISTTKATLGITPTTSTVSISTTEATLGFQPTAANLGVTTTEDTASGSFTPANTVVAASEVTFTPTKGTFTALGTVTYDAQTATLSISNSTSDEFWKSATGQAAGQTITYAAQSVSVTYNRATGVTGEAIAGGSITGATHVLATAELTGTKEFLTGASITGAENVLASATLNGTTTFVTGGSISGSALASASLDGSISVNQVTGVTVTLDTATATVTVSPDAS